MKRETVVTKSKSQPTSFGELEVYLGRRAAENEKRATEARLQEDVIWHRAKADTYRRVAEKVRYILGDRL